LEKQVSRILPCLCPILKGFNALYTEGHFRRLEQSEDRISELKNTIEIKEKTEKLLVKQHKTCKRNMQELTDSIKKPNLRIMGIEKGVEVQAKGICNIFNKYITKYIQQNNNRKFPKSRENYAHSGIGSLQDTKET
jgi:CHASE3 domain sensor protein